MKALSTLGIVGLGIALAPGSAFAIGILVPADRSIEPLAIRFHRVQTTIRERVAETRIEQTFRNHTGQSLEATYVFPVPEGAVVSGFAMWVNGQRQEGELLEAGEARRIYEAIVAQARDPGLVEHMGGNLFRARVFPILPNSDQRIELRFTQTLGYAGGIVHYRYPLRTAGRSARTLEDLTFTVNVVSRTPIRAVYSPTHAVAVERPDEHRATVGYEGHAVELVDDFDLYYTVHDRDVGLSLLTHRPEGDEGYFIALVAPRAEVTTQQIAAKEVLFVCDTSASMAGDKMERAKAALLYMIERLNPRDHFQVARFSTDVELLFDEGHGEVASGANVARALERVRRFEPEGGTAIEPALLETLRQTRPAGAPPRMVVFLTDGLPTVGETDTSAIVRRVRDGSGDAQLFVFGVGDDVNTTFLDQLAAANRGVGEYFRDGAEMEQRLSSFYDKVAYPVLTDLRIAFPRAQTFDVFPRDLGHLYRGGQLLVVGRYRGEGRSRVELSGRASHERERRTFGYDIRLPDREDGNDWLPRLWATRKIGYLLDEIRLSGEQRELRAEVVTLASRFGIVTPYTSYLVVEESVAPDRGDARRPNVDNATPAFDGFSRLQAQQAVRAPSRAPPSRGGSYEPAREREEPEPSAMSRGGGFDSESDSEEDTDEDMDEDMDEDADERADERPAPVARAPSGSTGEAGRRISARVRAMREAEQADRSLHGVIRVVGIRTFRNVNGVWIDTALQPSMRTLRVRYMGPAYFDLIRLRPELRARFAIGLRVHAVLDATRAILVDPDARALRPGELDEFLAHHRAAGGGVTDPARAAGPALPPRPAEIP